MNYEKTGKLIQELRKEKGLRQGCTQTILLTCILIMHSAYLSELYQL